MSGRPEQNALLKEGLWYSVTRLGAAAAAGAAIAAFAVEPAADMVHPFHGGTRDMVACQGSLSADKTTQFATDNVPEACSPWQGTVTLTHVGEDYKLLPTKVGEPPKKVVTQKAAEFLTYPEIGTFNSENKGGAEAADAARDGVVERLRHDIGAGVSIVTLVGAVGITLLKRRNTKRRPKSGARDAYDAGPEPSVDMPTASSHYPNQA